jgi:hypothetical protein
MHLCSSLDHDIHVHSAAQELGFSSFKDFLHSEHMKVDLPKTKIGTKKGKFTFRSLSTSSLRTESPATIGQWQPCSTIGKRIKSSSTLNGFKKKCKGISHFHNYFSKITRTIDYYRKELRRKPRFWTPKGAKNFRPQMQKLLLKRHKMRMNIPESDEEEVFYAIITLRKNTVQKPEHPPPTRGRWVNRGGHPTSGRGRWVNRGGCEPSSSAKKRFP